MVKNKDTELVVLAQQGDVDAFEELYHMYYKQAYYLALKISNCDADAKDAAQETFIEIQKSLKDLKEPASFKKWMMQIVVSKCNKIFRKNKYAILDPDIINAMDIEEKREYMSGKISFDKKTRKEVLFTMMSKLTLHQREILVLTYFEQLSIKEMADILQIPEGTVKSRMMNAKAALKQQVHEFELKERISFRLVPLPFLLMLLDRKNFLKLFKIKPKSSIAKTLFTNPILLVASVATCGVVSAAGYSYLQEQEQKQEQHVQSEAMPQLNKKLENTPKDLYFKLKDWAHCKVEMREKTQDDIQQMKVYYDLLKEENGAYYRRLQLQNWAQDFEDL